MIVETQKENLCINKLVATKKEILFVEGDMIVPDSKPDILNTISTSGVVCVYKKEVIDGKVRIDGAINSYIMYLADNSEESVRGLNTSLDFSDSIEVQDCLETMNAEVNIVLKSIECKVLNGRKIGMKATMEIMLKVYSKEEIQMINNIQNNENMQILKEDIKVNSLVGLGNTKIYAKDTISIDNIDNLAEMLKVNLNIINKDIKISYNKILSKAEVEIKAMYLTEDNRIKTVNAKIPAVGFIDMPNITEDNICDIDYQVKNLIVKPNSQEEHSIYIEVEIEVSAIVYEEKQINFIQDLYSPCEILKFDKRQISTMTNRKNTKQTKQIREKIQIQELENKNLVDVDVVPVVNKENITKSKVSYEGDLELQFFFSNPQNSQVETKNVKIPWEQSIEGIENGENTTCKLDTKIQNQDFIIQDGGNVSCNIDMDMQASSYQNTRMNVIDDIEVEGEREKEDYNIIMYVVKKGDSLWQIAKNFGSTIEDIVRVNGIEDENLIFPGQKIFVPRYRKVKRIEQKVPEIVNYG